MRNLIGDYWDDFLMKKELPFVTRKSVPIIWHGDIDKYKNSELKVVTASINPHFRAFDKNSKQFLTEDLNYFEKVSQKNEITNDDKDRFINIFNNYFNTNESYEKDNIFSSYESLTKGLSAGYKGSVNAMLHIDLYSAISTDKLWSKLNKKEKNEIINIDISKKFLENLDFNIMFASVRRDVIETLFKDQIIADDKNIEHFYKIKNKKLIFAIIYKLKEDKYVIYGRNFNRPFGYANIEEKKILIDEITKINTKIKEYNDKKNNI